MDRDVIVRQTQIERETLFHIEQALHLATDWKTEGREFSRKLSSVRFIAQSYQRHLERLFDLEEHDGFMLLIEEACPELLPKIEELKQEHKQLRSILGDVMMRLDRVLTTDLVTFSRLCEELRELTRRLREHDQREIDLLSHAFSQDTGGDG